MISAKKQIAELRVRLIALLIWNACFWMTTLWCYICGATVLFFRFLDFSLAMLLPVALSGLLIACGLAAALTYRRWPTTETLAALIDARLSGGGIVMAIEAGQSDCWTSHAVPASQLVPRWNGKIPGLTLLASITFLILAARIPLAPNDRPQQHPLQIEAMVEDMEERVELLKEIGLVEEEQALEWISLLEALQQESRGLDPAATWEAFDQLSDRFEDTASIEIMSRRMEVQKREELVAALKAALQAYEENREAADAAMKELSKLLQKAAETNPNLKALLESLPQFGVQPVASRCLSKEEAQLLAERLAQMTEEDLARMQQMLQQGLCQSSDCQKPGGTESLKRFLEKNPGCTNLAICAGLCPNNGWGVSRGPGSAPISWLGDSSEEAVDFTEHTLPASMLDSMAGSTLVGESYGTPEVNTSAPGSAGGVLVGTQVKDSAATTHTILPRHRGAVNRFFMRSKEK